MTNLNQILEEVNKDYVESDNSQRRSVCFQCDQEIKGTEGSGEAFGTCSSGCYGEMVGVSIMSRGVNISNKDCNNE